MDKIKVIEEKIKEIMEVLEIYPTESNKDTPARIAKMWTNELFKHVNDRGGQEFISSLKTFPVQSNGVDNEMIINITPFHSTCEHHWLPFSGIVCIGYVPNQLLFGLSKFPRVIEFFSKRPTLQERLTKDIYDCIEHFLDANFLAVRVIAEHSCVGCRGVEKPSLTDTIQTNNNILENKRYCEEFLMRTSCYLPLDKLHKI